MVDAKADEPIQTERELRLSNRNFLRNFSNFNNVLRNKSHSNIDQAKTFFDNLDQCYSNLIKMMCSKRENLTAEEEIEELIDKIDLIKQQFDLARNALSSLEEQQIILAQDLNQNCQKKLSDKIKG